MTATDAPPCAVLTIRPAEGDGMGATVAVHLDDGAALDAAALLHQTRGAVACCTLAAWFLGEPAENDTAQPGA